MKKTKSGFVAAVVAAAVAFGLSTIGVACADASFPNRAVQIVVPYPAGGLTDILTRGLADRLSKMWSQPVLTVNKPGANGVLATSVAAKADPDGYTILFGTDATLAANLSLYANIPYEPARDFIPLTLIGTYNLVLVVHESVPVKTLAELVDYAKKQKEPLNFASVGTGSTHHLSMELFKSLAGFDAVHVPYRGGAPATTAIIAGEVPMMFNGPATVQGYVESGKVRPLAVSGKMRSTVFPNVPTIAESGYPTFDMVNWYGLLVPAHTPPAIVEKLTKDIMTVTASEDFKAWALARGIDPQSSGPEPFRSLMVSDRERLGKLINSIGLKLQQ